MGREVSLSLENVTISHPTAHTLPRDNTPWVLEGIDDIPRSNLYAETFVETTRLAILASRIMEVV